MYYFQHRRQLALQAGVVMFEGNTLPDRMTLLLGIYSSARQLEESVSFTFSDDRGNTIAFLQELKSALLVRHFAKGEAAYIQTVITDTSVHSLLYEEVIVQRIKLMLMEWPEDLELQSAWARCPINSPRLTDVMDRMWPELSDMLDQAYKL